MQDKVKRLSAAYDYLRGRGIVHTQNDVAAIMGANKTNVSYAFNGNEKYLTDSFLKRFNKAFGDIFNIDWLLTGEGEMLKEAHSRGEDIEVMKISVGKVIPFFDAEAAAGLSYGMSMAEAPRIGMIEIGGLLKDSECALRVYGNSMIPNYPPGCVIGLKKHRDSFIEPGKVYVVETQDNRYIKRLYYNKEKTAFRCLSDNPIKHTDGPMLGDYLYPDFEIPLDEVQKLFRVTGVIKRNTI